MRFAQLAPLFLCAVAAAGPSFAADPASPEAPLDGETVETVEVTGSRLGAEIRPVKVLDRGQIERLPVADAAGALSYVAGVDLRERAPFGAQADLSLYGSGFEGVLVLVDGMPVVDPQTGHHLLEFLPPLVSIERIEVLEGPAAAAYGPGAFGGVVQIVTRRPEREAKAAGGLAAGQNGLRRGELYGTAGDASLAASRTVADGYRPDTDLADMRLLGRFARGPWDVEALYQDKRFGAWEAYSGTYPNQWESVRGVAGRAAYRGGGWEAAFGWRRKRDEFLLDRDRPSFYDAVHTTDGQTLSLTRRVALGRGAEMAVGLDGSRESIDSNVLGDRDRGRGGLFAELHVVSGGFETSVGARAERAVGRTWFLPQIAAMRAAGSWRFTASLGRAMRLPSFTELYSNSPAYVGDPNLVAETAWGLELGARGPLGPLDVSAKVFHRRGDDMIDLVRPVGETGPFREANIESQRLDGVDAAVEGPLGGGFRFRVDGMYLAQSADWPRALDSRYVGDILKHRETAAILYGAGPFSATATLRAQQRQDGVGHAEVDLRFASRLGRGGRTEISLDVRNALDQPDRNFYGGELAGRWIWLGVEFR